MDSISFRQLTFSGPCPILKAQAQDAENIKEDNNMTELTRKKSYAQDRMAAEAAAAKKTMKKAIAKVLTYVPAVIIFGLIALYYIQLSHMA